MKNLMIYTALVLSRFYLRYIPIYQGKETLWKKLCRPYINWRGMKSVSKTRSGFKIYCDLQDIIQEKIVYFDEWEPNLTAFLNRRLKSGDVFIDIGANIGYYSLLAERRVGPGGSVLAIEASPSIYDLLRKNISLNEGQRIRAVHRAVTDYEGT